MLLKDLAYVEQLLKDVALLSGLARLLPQGACAGRAPPPGHAPASNVTTWPPNSTAWGGGIGPNATDTPRGDGVEAEGEGKEGDGRGPEGGPEKGKEKEEPQANPRSQFSAFVQLWAGLQPILCGNNR